MIPNQNGQHIPKAGAELTVHRLDLELLLHRLKANALFE
jgi:hypothetical protein